MKGIFKNDFYMVYANAKAFSIFMLLFGIFAVVCRNRFRNRFRSVLSHVLCVDWDCRILGEHGGSCIQRGKHVKVGKI